MGGELLTIESVTVQGGVYGPGKLVMKLEKLDMPSYMRFNDSVQAAVRKLLDKSFKDIPGPVGVNNHRSYRATQNRPLMAAFMPLGGPPGPPI